MAETAELAAFIREHVRSVWALELLLLLKRDPGRAWAADQLVAELRASIGLVAEILARLEQAGLAVRADGDGYSYRPATAALAQLSDRLESAYRERPVAIVNLIAAPRDPLQSLADAFRFRRGDGE